MFTRNYIYFITPCFHHMRHDVNYTYLYFISCLLLLIVVTHLKTYTC